MKPSLHDLKERLAQTKDFRQVFTYFFDHFGEDPDFLDRGEATDDPTLAAVLRAASGQLLQRPTPQVDGLRMIRLAADCFIHGSFLAHGNVATFIYFDDLRLGLLSVHDRSSGQTRLARFSTVQGIPMPSLN